MSYLCSFEFSHFLEYYLDVSLQVLLSDLVFASDLGSHQLRIGKDFYLFGSQILAVRTSAKKASYSAVLLVTGKDKPREISTTIPSLFSTITPAPFPLELEDPSTKTVHSFVFPSSGKVISARKSTNTCDFSAFLNS